MRLERQKDGTLHVLIGDMKSTVEVKVEHRLQVAFYRLMLERLFKDDGIAHEPVQMGILFRPPADPTPEEQIELQPLKDAAKQTFGLDDALLEVVADPQAYVQSVHDLVLASDSTARRVAQAPFEKVPFCLSFKCDGCLYNEFCMKWSAEQEDLSLLPYMTGTEKEALRRAGITTIQALATLKDFAPGSKADLIPAPGREAQVKQIAATWPVGPRLDELIHRARSFRRSVPQGRHPGPQLHPRQGQQQPAGVHAGPEPEPRPHLHRRPARLPRRPSLPARCPGRRLQGRHPGRQAVGGAHDERPARFGGEGAATVRGLDP